MKIFAVAYFMWLGWQIRKSGVDEKIMRKLEAGFDALAARAGEEFGAAFNDALMPPQMMADLTATSPDRVTEGM
jgi:threonine/homoserine/homoserine lactone efflux protein